MLVRLDGSAFQGKKTLSGVGQYSRMLYEALSDTNQVNVEVVTGPFKNGSDLLNKFNLIYNKLSSYRLVPYFDVFHRQADLMIFPNFATWPSLKSTLKCVVIHDLTHLYYPEFVEKKNLKYLNRVIPHSIRTSDYIITVSETVKKEISKEFKIDKKKIIVTPVPQDSRYNQRDKPNDISKKYDTPKDEYILFVGNLEPRKNLPCLIKAYSALDQAFKDKHRLVIAGNKGWNIKNLIGVKNTDSDLSNIILTGYVDPEDMPTLYQKASLFVFPSLYEGFGIPVLEAMASDTPVIAADIKVLRETAGEAAIYFDPTQPEDLKEKIATTLDSPSLRRKLISLGRENIKRFSWRDNIQRIMSIIED